MISYMQSIVVCCESGQEGEGSQHTPSGAPGNSKLLPPSGGLEATAPEGGGDFSGQIPSSCLAHTDLFRKLPNSGWKDQ